MVDQTGAVQALAAEILARARQEAEEARQEARAQADDVLAEARRAAEAEARQRLATAEKEARATIRRAVSTAEVAAQRSVLETREQLIDQALDEAWQRAVELTDADLRRRSLLSLIVEAVAALGGGEVTLQLAARDRALATSAFLTEARDRLAKEGVQARLSVADEPAPIAGGVIAVKEGGRLLFDNSFRARLDRQRDPLREEIWQILAGGRRQAAAA